jgi:4-hydroxybenzoate polyprenyltransferase
VRWWTYQKERFPIVAHGPLILAFSACAVSYSALLRDGLPVTGSFGVAFVTCLLFFLQLRIADEFKDAEDDAKWRPYRAVPRGLVKLSELRVVFLVAALVQGALAWWWDPRLWWVLGIGWAYLSLMSVEFFARDWLKARPVVYLLTHMGIMPLVDLYATACDWMPASGAAPGGLLPFLAASFFNGLVIEIGRKLRQPEDEEEGVETYSRLWGKRGGAWVWSACQVATLVFAVMAAMQIGFALPVMITLLLGLVGSGVIGLRFVRGNLKGKWIEAASGVWTLMLYSVLGVIPLLIEWMGRNS